MKNRQTVAQAIVASLARHGVTTMFSQSLPSAILLAAEDAGIRQFAYREENAGAVMADGYARISNRAAVVTAQNGPAATLLVPGLAEALKASVPIVALVQDVNRGHADRNAFQELDHLRLFQAVTKWSAKVTEANRVVDYVDLAFATATSGRPGPVALMLPADLLIEEIEVQTARPRAADLGRFPLDCMLADPARIEAAADLLAGAERPLIVAGGGVHLSGATAELAALQEAAAIPVMTTVMGKGAVDDRHPLSIGVGGYAMGRLAPARHMRTLVETADVVLLVGTRTNQNGTDSWTLYPDGALYIHIDVDGGEIGRNYEALRLAGDAKLVLAALSGRLAGRRGANPAAEATIARGRELHARDIAAVTDRSARGPARPERLMADMQTVLTPETIVAADASYSSLWVACYLQALTPGMRFLTPRGLAGLGWGLRLAMGARLARPGVPVLCVVGDGGFAHVWAELETARRTGAGVVVTVLNNGVLGYQKDAEDVKFNRHTSACYFAPVDHAQIARATGCHGIRVEDAADYLPALTEALARDGTTVIDVMTDPAAYPPVTFFDGLDAIRSRKAAGQYRGDTKTMPAIDVSHLRTRFEDYRDRYQTIAMRREDGILELRLHTGGGPLQWGRLPHAELEEAFLNIGRDRANQVVILTGTGAAFSGPRVEDAGANRSYHRLTPDEWGELAWESKGLLGNMLAIDCPMIAAVNGPALRHPELPAMCDIVLASETASFQDSAHYNGGLVPGDGVHVVFSLIMGLNRARYFLMTGQELHARQAQEAGLVNEILPAEALLPRAWEHARRLLLQPELNRRFARTLVTEQLRRQINDLLPYGLALEALAATR